MQTHPLTIARIARGWSQAYLAEQLAVSTRTIARWELGQTLPYRIYREQLCRLFEMNGADLGLLPVSDEIDQVPTEIETSPSTSSTLPDIPAVYDPMIPEALGQAHRLLGRDSLLQQVKHQLLAGKSLALTALQGLPGIGKTALAVAIATDTQVQAHFSDGILWAGLGPQADVLGLLTRWGSLLGLRASDIDSSSNWSSWAQAMRASIGQRRMLLVIDDAWEAEAALALQVGGPHCAHLLTTRSPQVAFAFAQETTIAVPELVEIDGLSLLARFVPQVVAQERDAARKLVRMVGGLPLALNLLGKYLAKQAFTGQPRRVRTALASLQEREHRLRVSLPTPLSERPVGLAVQSSLSLQATITLSIEQLSQEEQTALSALALFPAKPNSFSEEAALSVSGKSVETLDALWDAGLLESSGPGRYTLHQTIADYAHEQGIEQAAHARLLAWTAELVKIHSHDYALLEQELVNIEAALVDSQTNTESKSEHHQRLMIQIILDLVDFLRSSGHYIQAESWLQHGLQTAETLKDQVVVMRILAHLCEVGFIRGEYERAEQYGQQGLRLTQQLEQPKIEGKLQARLSSLAVARGDFKLATTYSERRLQIARASGDQQQIGRQLIAIGQLAWREGNLTQLKIQMREGHALIQHSTDQELICDMLSFLGTMYMLQSEYEQAKACCEQALPLARQLGFRPARTVLLNTLGGIALKRGQWEQARSCFQEALELARQMGLYLHVPTFLSNLGDVALKQGDYQQAEHYFREGLTLIRRVGNMEHLVYILDALGQVVDLQGDELQASLYLQEGLDLARQSKASWLICIILNSWGELYLRHQQLAKAATAFEQSLDSYQSSTPDPEVLAQIRYGQGRVAAKQGAWQEAVQHGQEALRLLKSIGHIQVQEVEQWLHSLPG
jgi:tetratricopeptide (TPR) repeat protein/transcriptional regulator with XRE-family HTH domain